MENMELAVSLSPSVDVSTEVTEYTNSFNNKLPCSSYTEISHEADDEESDICSLPEYETDLLGEISILYY